MRVNPALFDAPTFSAAVDGSVKSDTALQLKQLPIVHYDIRDGITFKLRGRTRQKSSLRFGA
jgi:hypothetical protein